MRSDPRKPVLLRAGAVARRLGVSRTTLWRMRRDDPDFPRPVRLTARVIAWRVRDLDDWVDRRAADDDLNEDH